MNAKERFDALESMWEEKHKELLRLTRELEEARSTSAPTVPVLRDWVKITTDEVDALAWALDLARKDEV